MNLLTIWGNIPCYIDWNFGLGIQLGSFTLRYYALCWMLGLTAAFLIVKKLYQQQKLKEEDFDPLFFYCFIGILAGARLGHCLFYDPGYYLSHITEMFLPIKQTAEGWKFSGYEGLASHGGTIGLMIALWLYVRKTKLNIMRVLDNIAIATPITACFIRLGNLMNSEIIGYPTDVPWAFIFHTRSALVDGMLVPRHPAQLYEALAYLCFFFIGLWLYKRYPRKVGTGFYFGFCLTSIFLFRFFVEYLKEAQGGIDDGTMAINVGQILSIPFVVLGVACMTGGKWLDKIAEKR